MCSVLLPLLIGLFVVAGWPTQSAAQQMEDVVYLKDGSIIRGTIVEQRPGESILIRTRDGNQFRYTMAQIDRMAKEAPVGVVTSVSEKSPGVAWLLSFLIVGGGQAYNGQWGKAGAFFGGAVVGYGLMLSGANSDDCVYYDECSTLGAGALIWLGSWIWSQIDAPISASSINRRRRGLAQIDLRPRVQSLTPAYSPTTVLEAKAKGASSGNKWGLTLATLRF
jgi:hypothetical protein